MTVDTLTELLVMATKFGIQEIQNFLFQFFFKVSNIKNKKVKFWLKFLV